MMAFQPKHSRPGLGKRAFVIRLRKIRNQIEASEEMVDINCSNVLIQVVAARQAWESLNKELIESHRHKWIENATTRAEGRRHFNLCSPC